MGGNAMKKVLTSRMSKPLFQKIKADLVQRLSPYIDVGFTLDLPDKTSFGDVDCLYFKLAKPVTVVSDLFQAKFEASGMTGLLEVVFQPKEIVKSGDVVSFAYEHVDVDESGVEVISHHQVDMINCFDSESRRLLDFYFSYGDVGGVLGRMVNHVGLKLGHKGLYMNLLNETLSAHQYGENEVDKFNNKGHGNNIETLVLSTDLQEICDYLTLDYSKWATGFVSNAEIFDWLMACRFFSVDVFRHLNHDHRKRQQVRPFYNSFLMHIGIEEALLCTDLIGTIGVEHTQQGKQKGEKKYKHQLTAIRDFAKESVLDDIITQIETRRRRSEKFNGHLLMDLYGVTQEYVGDVMREFKVSKVNEQRTLNMSQSNVNVEVLAEVEDHNEVEASDNTTEVKYGGQTNEECVLWEQWLDMHTSEEVMRELEEFLEQ